MHWLVLSGVWIMTVTVGRSCYRHVTCACGPSMGVSVARAPEQCAGRDKAASSEECFAADGCSWDPSSVKKPRNLDWGSVLDDVSERLRIDRGDWGYMRSNMPPYARLCVCLSVCVRHVCAHILTHKHVRTHTHKHTYTHTRKSTTTNLHTQTYKRKRTHAHLYVQIQTF